MRSEIARTGPSITAVADQARVYRTTAYNILSGHTWGDSPTIAVLGIALGAKLWDHSHLEDR